MRAPEDSPRNTSGMPRSVATRFMWAILRPLVAALDAPNTVKSLETIAASRPAILPKPAILPSDGDLFGQAAYLDHKPDCPAGGDYELKSVNEKCTCNMPKHTE